jgi:hypothetical protein
MAGKHAGTSRVEKLAQVVTHELNAEKNFFVEKVIFCSFAFSTS